MVDADDLVKLAYQYVKGQLVRQCVVLVARSSQRVQLQIYVQYHCLDRAVVRGLYDQVGDLLAAEHLHFVAFVVDDLRK